MVGIGPSGFLNMTNAAVNALNESDIIVGYQVYTKLIEADFPEKEIITTTMKKETERCKIAIEKAVLGHTVSMICSGDAGIYGMAALIFELAQDYPPIEIIVVAGVTAATSGAAVLGAPLTNDFAVISLSDLLTPYAVIEKRLNAAASGDFVICLYNPSSKKRADYLKKACDIILKYRSGDTLCGLVKNISRDGESAKIFSLSELRITQVDMFTTVYIGNSATKKIDEKMVTIRGYNI